ncbi:MAG: NAD(P)-binding domain-containing protein [Verrucomicrobiota bacterium]|nr:NAD(P)-binding domain-containing protein [Verrucomicrobiota bacterium]
MSIRTRRNVGVIGLGIIGSRVADNLRQRGFHVFVWNRTPRPVPNFVGSAAEVAELCDFIQIFVSDDEALLQTAQRITRDLTPNHVVMAHCTVSPDTMRACAEIIEKRGARFLDAPFTGSKMAAENGQLVYYVGGDEVALRQARPVLEASSKEIIEMGRVGDATTIKVATNMVTAASVQAVAEALTLVHKSGLSVDKFTAAMKNNGSNSATVDMKLPMMIQGNFETNFSVKHMLKDVVIATRLARGFGIEFGATDASRHGLTEELRQGRGDEDYSSLFRQYYPAGGALEREIARDDQPQLPIDEVKSPETERVAESPAAESTGAPDAKTEDVKKDPSSDLVALSASSPTPTDVEVAARAKLEEGNAAPPAAMAQENSEGSREAALSDVTNGANEPAVALRSVPETVAKSSETSSISAETASSSVVEGKGEESRGLWGGFWKRRTDS